MCDGLDLCLCLLLGCKLCLCMFTCLHTFHLQTFDAISLVCVFAFYVIVVCKSVCMLFLLCVMCMCVFVAVRAFVCMVGMAEVLITWWGRI